MWKSNEKKSLNYFRSIIKCRQNKPSEWVSLQQEKNNGFWLLWGIFKEYMKQNFIMAVLRKANIHSVDKLTMFIMFTEW